MAIIDSVAQKGTVLVKLLADNIKDASLLRFGIYCGRKKPQELTTNVEPQ
jgi:hypothetical protein